MHNFYIKRVAAVLAVALCILTLAGCGQAAALQRPEPSEGVQKVTITGACAISQTGDVFTVTGSIDVMNGTYIDVSVVAQDGAILANHTFQKSDEPISVEFTLTADQLEGVVDMKGYICCAPSYYHKQTDEVYAAYGKKFENFETTENIVWNNEGVIALFASDWLYGEIPSPTTGPTTEPSESGEASASGDTTPSA